MNFLTFWGKRHPAYLVFLIDQSASMQGTKKKVAAMNVQNNILEVIRSNILCEGVRDRAFITAIAYGKKNNPVEIIRSDWVSKWADDIYLAKINGTCIIPDSAEGKPSMGDGFMEVNTLIDEWITSHENGHNNCLGPIMVYNITGGVVDDISNTTRWAKMLMEHPNTMLFNILIQEENSECIELCLPTNKYVLKGFQNDNESRFLFDISSCIKEYAYMWQQCGFDNISYSSRCLFVSFRENIPFCRVCCTVEDD